MNLEKPPNLSNIPTQEMTPVRNNQIIINETKKKKFDFIKSSISPKKNESQPTNTNSTINNSLPSFHSSQRKNSKYHKIK